MREHFPDATYTGYCEKSPVYHRRTKLKKVSVPEHTQSLDQSLAPQNSEPALPQVNQTQAPSQQSRPQQFHLQFPKQSSDSQPSFFPQPPCPQPSHQSTKTNILSQTSPTPAHLTLQKQSPCLVPHSSPSTAGGHVPHTEQQQTSGDETGATSVLGALTCNLFKPTNNQ